MQNVIIKDSYGKPLGCFGNVNNLNVERERVSFVEDEKNRELIFNPEYNRWESNVDGYDLKFQSYEILTNSQIIERGTSDEYSSFYRLVVSQYHIEHDNETYTPPVPPRPERPNTTDNQRSYPDPFEEREEPKKPTPKSGNKFTFI